MSEYGTPPPDPNLPQQQFQQFAPGPSAPHVPDYMIWAILLTVVSGFCCGIFGLPLGIASLVYTNRVNNKKAQHDFAGAIRDAAMAKKLVIVGTGLLIVSLIALAVLVGLSIAFDDGTA